jgi:two-component system, NtrC family, nitrogen regulation response regulator NtrX
VTPAPSILVADDDPTIRRVIVRVIQRVRPDAAIVDVSDGMQAIGAIGHTSFTLVITDYHMPRASGLDVLTAVMARSPAVPVVIVSAHLHLEPQVLAAGAVAFLAKPFTVEQLATLVRRYVP